MWLVRLKQSLISVAVVDSADRLLPKSEWQRKHICQVQLIKCKTFPWAKLGLTVPPVEVYEMCVAVEKIVRTNLESLSLGQHVMRYLCECVVQGEQLYSYNVSCACPYTPCWLHTEPNCLTLSADTYSPFCSHSQPWIKTVWSTKCLEMKS